MKIRTGFVANSSSSSFIVSTTKEPKTSEEASEMWFKKEIKEEIANYVFASLRKINFDFMYLDKLKELKEYKEIDAKINKDIDLLIKKGKIDFCEVREKYPQYDIILELLNVFVSETIYQPKIYKMNELSYTACDDSEFKAYCEKNGFDSKSIYREKVSEKERKNHWKTEQKLEKEFLSMYSHKLLELFEKFINKFSGKHIYYGEFSDDTQMGSEVEHHGPWSYFDSQLRFSHH